MAEKHGFGAKFFLHQRSGQSEVLDVLSFTPPSPIIETASERELALLRLARGGFETTSGTLVHDYFLVMAERGWVKDVAFEDNRTFWKLSGAGLKFAYFDSAP